MKIVQILQSRKFDKQYKKLPDEIKKAYQKQLGFLLSDSEHPSLCLKKMRGEDNIWECRINISYRFTFQIENNIISLRTIGTHSILKFPLILS